MAHAGLHALARGVLPPDPRHPWTDGLLAPDAEGARILLFRPTAGGAPLPPPPHVAGLVRMLRGGGPLAGAAALRPALPAHANRRASPEAAAYLEALAARHRPLLPPWARLDAAHARHRRPSSRP